MASKASKAAKAAKAAEAARAAENRVSVWGIIFKFILLIGLVIVVTLGITLGHNCRSSDKPWIPKSQGFCNDAAHLFTKYQFRDTTLPNLEKALSSLQVLLAEKSLPYAKNAVERGDALLQKYMGEYYVKAITFCNDTLGPQLQNAVKFGINVSEEVYEHAVEYSAYAKTEFNKHFPKVVDATKDYYHRVVDYFNNLVNAH